VRLPNSSVMTWLPDPHEISNGLLAPTDDGQASHLVGLTVPAANLPSTAGPGIDFHEYVQARSVVFCYPATGMPGRDPAADWELIPGAPGCTVQALGFKRFHAQFEKIGFRVAGLSTQSISEQAEFAARNQIPYPLFSDANLVLTSALRLPRFEISSRVFLKRHALIIECGAIIKVFYPVFPSHENAARVLCWLQNTTRIGVRE
jgi:peroxiredoxin